MTRCRLYIDEVGTGDLKVASENPNERYLSLTGLITRIDMYDRRFVPELAELKSAVFGSEGSNLILHRREIMRREGAFARLRDADIGRQFDDGMLHLFRDLPYLASTVAMDKKLHLEMYGEWTREPYHYCLESLVERFVLWMNRHQYRGDVVIEGRNKNLDKKVKKVFQEIYEQGTFHIKPEVIQRTLTSHEIKFAAKPDNCPAMQIVDLLAHPSFRAMRFEKLGQAQPDDFGSKVVHILEGWKYARHPQTKIKIGWGKKWLPK